MNYFARKIRQIGGFTAILVLFNGCSYAQHRVSGNRDVTRENRSAGDFEELHVAGSMNVFLTIGKVTSAAVEAESNLLPYIEIRKEGDKMIVKFKNGTNIESHKPVNVYLSATRVDELNLAGSGTIKVENTLKSADEIELTSAGSGNIQAAVDAPEVKVKISGSGDIQVSGQTKEAEADILGSGSYKGQDLKSEQTEIKIAGSGNAYVYASVKLEAKILGSGSVYHKGGATTSSHIAGSGKLIKQD